MGQKTNPIGNRLGIIRGWESNWFGGKDFAEKVVEDEKIRIYLNARIAKGGIARIIIERTLKRITVTIHTSRPGIIIGKGGSEVDRIREELKTARGPARAIQLGFEKAFGSILDANVTTLIVAVILFMLGSGPVKGFAVTLGLGILCSVFTAIYVTQMIIAGWFDWRRPKAITV